MIDLISIKAASELFGVTTKTLRNWDKSGKLVPIKTIGGHRRYSLSIIKKLVSNEEDSGNICNTKSNQ